MTPPPDPNVTVAASATPVSADGATIAQFSPLSPAPSDLEVPGYEILGELGRGGMGVVYKARQVSLNRLVALKMLPGSQYAESHELVRFLAEAEAVAAVRHPHVVQVYDFGSQGSRPYFAMEYLGGGSLVELIRKSGRLTPTTAATILEKIARGVHAAHDLGIVHRDIKPQNVLIDADGEPKVTDFGLAKRGGRTDLTRTGAVMGTPNYMAPEQAAGKTKFVGPAADIYALGVILYECLTSRTPFIAEDTVQLLVKVVEDEPESIRRHSPDVPRDLEAICMKCLRKEPHARYATAEELAADLRRFLNGESVMARTTGVFGKMVGALGRSLKDVEFAAYGSCLFWIAGLMLTGEILVFLALIGVFNLWVIPFIQWSRIGAFLVVLRWYRDGPMLPTTATERQLWALCTGYILTCVVGSFSLRAGVFGFDPGKEMFLYQPLAALTALLFFSLGSIMWGWCYAFGLTFLAAGLVMAADLRLSPLIFGLLWAAILIVIGVRLKKLARKMSLTRTS